MQGNEVATVPEPVATKTDQGVQVRKIGVTFENDARLEVIELDNATVVIAKSGLTVYAGAKGQVEHEVVLGMTFNEIRSGEKMETGKPQFIESTGSDRTKAFDYMKLHNGITLLFHKDRIVISTSSHNTLTEVRPGTGIVTIPIKEKSSLITLN